MAKFNKKRIWMAFSISWCFFILSFFCGRIYESWVDFSENESINRVQYVWDECAKEGARDEWWIIKSNCRPLSYGDFCAVAATESITGCIESMSRACLRDKVPSCSYVFDDIGASLDRSEVVYGGGLFVSYLRSSDAWILRAALLLLFSGPFVAWLAYIFAGGFIRWLREG